MIMYKKKPKTPAKMGGGKMGICLVTDKPMGQSSGKSKLHQKRKKSMMKDK